MIRSSRDDARGIRGKFSIVLSVAAILHAVAVAEIRQASADETNIDFIRDVRPILSNHCFKCHGPDEATREAGLRLDTPEGATEDLGGYRAIEPGDAEASELILRLTTDDEDMRMPPVGSGLDLSEAQISLLRQWIDRGAGYQQHWAFAPLQEPKARSIDRLIDRQLRKIGLERSPPADRETLIRRLSLDLLGVLPSADEVTSFAQDPSPGAFSRLVDRMLASPYFGEKWGRHWLDQARYADTNGYTIDSPRTMWPYRDWVIDAINQDLPFDQFTIEQLAGDLLPNPSLEQRVATGFHRNTLINQEGGTDPEQFRNEATVDRVNTTGAVWLGLTVGCAQCHTHKFDPLTQQEYYELFAFFNHAEDVNGVAPTVAVVAPNQQGKLAELERRVEEARSALKAFDRQREGQEAPRDSSTSSDPSTASDPWADEQGWLAVEQLDVRSDAGASFEPLGDGSWVVGGENGDRDTYRMSFRVPVSRITGLRLETLTHPSLPQGGPGRAPNGNFVLNEVELRRGDQAATWVHAAADHSQPNYDVNSAIDGDLNTGWAINGAKRVNVARTAVFVAEPIEVESSDESVTVTLTFGGKPAKYNIGRFRLAVTDTAPTRLGVPDPERAGLEAALQRARADRDRFTKTTPKTMVMRDRESPRKTHVQIRGDFLRPGEEVQPGTPAFLPPMQPAGDRTANRLDLARWLVGPASPLTARVTVNRIWMRLFGRGLVETENDFGLQGTMPTHPELLDALAWRLIEDQWSVKGLIRQIVLSETYRQSSKVRPEAESADPRNLYLARQARVRVDAEIVRDLTLSASGLLDRTIGGPSVYPPQPDGVYAFTQRSASWPVSQGADRYRRGMYTFFMRSAPHPMLTTFDAPSFNTTCTRRVRSNTPLQSLTLANDTAMVEAARGMAKRLLREEPAEGELIESAFWVTLSRTPTAAESAELASFLHRQREAFLKSPRQAAALAGVELNPSEGSGAEIADTARLAAATMLARVLMNLDEFITRE